MRADAMLKVLLVALTITVLSACGSLEKKSSLISSGDDKQKVLAVMGTPGDRQFQWRNEVWQYGQTGAGFGYHDYRMIWFFDGRVTGIQSYKNYTPATPASAHFRDIVWAEAPAH